MKKIFLYIVIGLLLLGIPATVFFIGQQRDIRTRAAPASTLTLTPSTQEVVAGGSNFRLNVDIDPGSNQVVSAYIYLTYDPTKLEAKTITNGASAPRVLNSGIIENGTASINVGAASNSQPITTRGTIAVITFTPIAATNNFTPVLVQFASNTFVGGLNEPIANVLVGTTPAKITITGDSANTTGTNFASGSGTLYTDATPTATPTAILTSALTPTLPASGSAESTGSATAFQILTPQENSYLDTEWVTIAGTAPPGSTVTIVVHSDTQVTATVTADANGNWLYALNSPLSSGLHNVVVSSLDPAGTTQTATSTFIVGVGNGTEATDATVSAIPVSGTIGTTLLLLGLGIFLMTSGIIVWHF